MALFTSSIGLPSRKPAYSRVFNGKTYVRVEYGLTKAQAEKLKKKIKRIDPWASVRTTYYKGDFDGRNEGYVVYKRG